MKKFYEYEVTSGYGTRTDPFTNEVTTHNGIDYDLDFNTEVKSNVKGTVTRSDYEEGGFGNYVVIKDGTGKLHYYAHLNVKTLQVGDTVNVNDTIGYSGSSGRSTGPHLHYEVRDSHNSNSSINPINYTDETFLSEVNSDIPSMDDYAWYDIKGKTQLIVFNIFKFIIMAMLIILFVVFITKSLDISIV